MSKRSRRVTPAILGSVISLALIAGCGEDDPQVDAAVFETVEQCVQSGEYPKEECETYFQQAMADQAATAPKYESQADCEAEFGAGKCNQGPEISGGDGADSTHVRHSYVPMAAGFLIGAAISQPLYRTYQGGKYGAFATSGGTMVGSKTGRTRLYSSVVSSRPSRTTTTMKRGGFGSMSRSAAS